MQKGKVINLVLIITSLIGYLEWGGGNSLFLFKGEIDIISMFFTDPGSVLHPLILLPLIGQAILLTTLFQKTPGKLRTYLGLGCIALLLLLMFFIGLINLNWKILLSTIPFIVTGFLAIIHHRKRSPNPTSTKEY